MSFPLSFKKPELLAKLESLRPAAEKADKLALIEHKKAEQAYLKRFKEAARAALKWDYETLKKNGFEVGAKATPEERRGHYSSRAPSPHCPQSRVEALDRLIQRVEHIPESQHRIIVQERGKYGAIWAVLMADVPAPKGMC